MIHYTAAMFLVSGGAVLADMTDHRTATIALLILWAFMAVMLVVAKAIDWVFNRGVLKGAERFADDATAGRKETP